MHPRPFLPLLLAAWFTGAAHAQAPAPGGDGWQACAAFTDGAARLACFDTWARGQQPQPAVVVPGPPPSSATAPVPPPVPAQVAGAQTGCRDRRYSALSRFWELERATDCGDFELRGWRPITLSVAASDSVNELPASPAPGRTATQAEDFRTTEARIQLSARVKVASDLLTRGDGLRKDSLWFGFSQQSYWQFFSGGISRPFRTTDYEPEAFYLYPADYTLGPVRLRYLGLGVSHNSNGRQLPQSRSWNRGLLMAGAEVGPRLSFEARVWKRMFERDNDDNPDIVQYLGRGELAATWHADNVNTYMATLRHTLRSGGRGALRLEYFRAVGRAAREGLGNDLRLHAQFFSGYGDSLLDYNRKRNVFSLGLALVDW